MGETSAPYTQTDADGNIVWEGYEPCTCTLACIPQGLTEDQICKEYVSCQEPPSGLTRSVLTD